MQVDWVEFPKIIFQHLLQQWVIVGHLMLNMWIMKKVETLDRMSHVILFEYFGGVPQECLYDNMKTVILRRNMVMVEVNINLMLSLKTLQSIVALL